MTLWYMLTSSFDLASSVMVAQHVFACSRRCPCLYCNTNPSTPFTNNYLLSVLFPYQISLKRCSVRTSKLVAQLHPVQRICVICRKSQSQDFQTSTLKATSGGFIMTRHNRNAFVYPTPTAVCMSQSVPFFASTFAETASKCTDNVNF